MPRDSLGRPTVVADKGAGVRLQMRPDPEPIDHPSRTLLNIEVPFGMCDDRVAILDSDIEKRVSAVGWNELEGKLDENEIRAGEAEQRIGKVDRRLVEQDLEAAVETHRGTLRGRSQHLPHAVDARSVLVPLFAGAKERRAQVRTGDDVSDALRVHRLDGAERDVESGSAIVDVGDDVIMEIKAIRHR